MAATLRASVGRFLMLSVALLLVTATSKHARPDEPKKPEPKAVTPPVPGNPRGEPLLYETNSTVVRPQGATMWSLAVSPDGKFIATSHGNGNTRGQIKLWDAATGKVKLTIEEPKGTRSVAYSADGKIIASGCYDGAIRFYDAENGTLWAAADEKSGGHKGNGVNRVVFFKDGKYLASAGLDNMIRIWDVAAVVAKRKAGEVVAFSPVAVFEGHTQGVLSVAASEDGLSLISGSFDKTARVWDVPDPLPAMGEKAAVV